MAALNYLFFWNHKAPQDNDWRPQPGETTIRRLDNLPRWLKRQDLEATCVDAAPFVFGIGALAHIRQANDFGFTARASIFANPKTLLATHRATLYVTPAILACQALGVEYRYFIPRWSHDRERRRDEEEVRKHIAVGRAYWAPIDVVLGGALADLAHREYMKAHGL